MINKKIPNKYSYNINPSRIVISLWLKVLRKHCGEPKKKKKTHNQNKTNKQTINQDKYVKSLFLNTLRCIYLSTKTDDTKNH